MDSLFFLLFLNFIFALHCILSFFFFGGTVVWIQGFTLARQVLSNLRMPYTILL
jgi:hypothetical protein